MHSLGGSLPADDLDRQMLSHSLCLVRPAELIWRVSPSQNYVGKVQVRAEFKFGVLPYSLVVTDPVWEAKCHHAGIGRHPHAVFSGPSDLVFLTVSLAAVPFHGLHYKLVAGVIELPEVHPVA
jgi:hypothetical protein